MPVQEHQIGFRSNELHHWGMKKIDYGLKNLRKYISESYLDICHLASCYSSTLFFNSVQSVESTLVPMKVDQGYRENAGDRMKLHQCPPIRVVTGYCR